MTVCVSGYSQHPTVAAAVGEVIGDVLERVDPHPDLVLLFASGRFAGALRQVVPAVQALLAPQLLVGSDVPRVFGGSDDRPSADGLLLLAAHLDGEGPLVPIRYDPSTPDVGWHTPDGSALRDDRVSLVFTEPSVATDAVPGTVVGVGGSSERGLVLDRTIHHSGGVGVQLPESVAEPFDYVLPLWEDVVQQEWDEATGAYVSQTVPESHGELFQPGDGAGLLLFAARSAAAPMGDRFDFEIAFDRFSGSVAGALAPVVVSPAPAPSPELKDRAICGLVIC